MFYAKHGVKELYLNELWLIETVYLTRAFALPLENIVFTCYVPPLVLLREATIQRDLSTRGLEVSSLLQVDSHGPWSPFLHFVSPNTFIGS